MPIKIRVTTSQASRADSIALKAPHPPKKSAARASACASQNDTANFFTQASAIHCWTSDSDILLEQWNRSCKNSLSLNLMLSHFWCYQQRKAQAKNKTRQQDIASHEKRWEDQKITTAGQTKQNEKRWVPPENKERARPRPKEPKA